MLFWKLSYGFIVIITCFNISFCLNYTDRLKAILLSNKHSAPDDNADVDSSKFQAEEWPDDDRRDDSDCSNTAENPTGQAEFDKHPVSKLDLRESSNGFEPVGDNDGGEADLNEIKSLAWKILKMTEYMKEVKKNKQQSGEAPKGSLAKEKKKRESSHQSSQGTQCRQRWGEWTQWSTCSVTCGEGQQIRWRHCINKHCVTADSEMQTKTCQLLDCSPGKFLGLD